MGLTEKFRDLSYITEPTFSGRLDRIVSKFSAGCNHLPVRDLDRALMQLHALAEFTYLWQQGTLTQQELRKVREGLTAGHWPEGRYVHQILLEPRPNTPYGACYHAINAAVISIVDEDAPEQEVITMMELALQGGYIALAKQFAPDKQPQ